MLRSFVLVLTLSGTLAACTDTSINLEIPPGAMMHPDFSDSVGFTGLGTEPF